MQNHKMNDNEKHLFSNKTIGITSLCNYTFISLWIWIKLLLIIFYKLQKRLIKVYMKKKK